MTQYEGIGDSLDDAQSVLGAMIRDVQLGRAKLSRQSMRRLQEEMDRAARHEELKLRPRYRKPGYTNVLRKQKRDTNGRWRERNPEAEYTLNRRWTRLLKHCREDGIECTLTYAEYESLMEGILPSDDIRLVRRDKSKGYSYENTVVMRAEVYFKQYLPLIRQAARETKLRKEARSADGAQ